MSETGVKTNLVVRVIPFDFDQVSSPIWNEAKPEWSHMVNGASLTMPYLEPFLIRTMREGMKKVTDEKLIADVKGFMAQEGQHFQNHRKYNETLKANGYENLTEVEDKMTDDYKRFQKKSLKWRLAYGVGFETMTLGVTDFLIDCRRILFQDADPIVTSLVLWHFVEEAEHKNVALDLYNALYPRTYFSRIRGLFAGSFHLMMLSRQGYMRMLKRDRLWNNWKSRVRLYRMIFRFFANVLPTFLRAMVPGFHPSKVDDPTWVSKWAHAYSDLPQDTLPLLDTSDPDIPPQFKLNIA